MTNGTARRVIAPRYGGPEVLEVVEEEVTQAGPGQVTIDVRAVGLNPADYKMVEGAYSKDPDALPVMLQVNGTARRRPASRWSTSRTTCEPTSPPCTCTWSRRTSVWMSMICSPAGTSPKAFEATRCSPSVQMSV